MVRPLLALSMLLLGLGCSTERIDTEGTGGGGEGGGSGGAGAEHPCPAGERVLEDGSCLPAGTQPDGCAAGELADGMGVCQPAGLRPEDCSEGFAHDGEHACEPILPAAPCPAGTWAIPGDTACRDFSDCGAGPWPDLGNATNVVYVDETANGQQDGSEANPYQTLQNAIDNASDGATLALAAGTFDGDAVIEGKALSVVGRCASLTSIATNNGEIGLTFGLGADNSSVRGLAVTGDGDAVHVRDASDVLLEGLWLHDLTGPGLVVETTTQPTTAVLGSSLVESTTGRGVWAIGAELTVDQSAIVDIAANAMGMGRAVDSDLGPAGERNQITVDRSLIARGVEVAMMVHASDAQLVDSVIADSLPRADARFGRALMVQTTQGDEVASLAVSGSVIDGAYDGGIVAATADLALDRVLVRDIEVNQDEGWKGYGVAAIAQAIGPASVAAHRLVVDRAHEVGIINIGSAVDAELVCVRNTDGVYGIDQPGVPTNYAGRGMNTQLDFEHGLPASSTVRGSVFDGNTEIGLAVIGASLQASGVLVQNTQPNTGNFGRGIAVQLFPGDLTPAEATITDTVVANNHEVGISVTGSTATLDGVAIRDTQPGPSGLLATGLVVEVHEATLQRSTAVARDVALSGHGTASVFALGATLTLDHCRVQDTAVQAGSELFGDGVLALSTVDVAQLEVVQSTIGNSARAGLASIGALVALEGSTIDCAAIPIAIAPGGGQEATLEDRGSNRCTCEGESAPCKALSTSIEPPEPPAVL